MSILLITGIPGAGKTLYAVSKLKKAIDDNMSLPADKQRKIYCDITGLAIEGIEKTPMDWRQTPPNSLLIYDEAQFHEEFKPNRGLSQYKQVEDLTIHRKTGHEIWFITQDPGRLHKDILAMVEMHHHLERPYGAKLATIYQYRGAERNAKAPTVKQRAERKTLFAYDKKLFDLYQSTNVDDDGIKLRLPKQLIFWCVALIAIVGFTIRLFFADGTQALIAKGMGKQQDEIKANLVDTSTNTDALQSIKQQNFTATDTALTPQQSELTRIAMVIASSTTCIAKNSKGQMLDVSADDCFAYANRDKLLQVSAMDNQIRHSHDIQDKVTYGDL